MKKNMKRMLFSILVFSFAVEIFIITLLANQDDHKSEAVINTSKPKIVKEDTKDVKIKKTAEVKKEAVVSRIPEKQLLDVPLLNQMDAPRLYNGCEITSLAMILNFFHINVTKNELADHLKSVPLTYENGLKGNPNDGFVGDVTGAQPGLGVYHGPVASLASQYINKANIKDISGQSFDEVIKALADGKPVWVITTSTFAAVNNLQTWNTPSGPVKISYSEHSVVITGYDKDSIYINNPYGQKNQRVDRSSFIDSWEQMGKQAIYFTGV